MKPLHSILIYRSALPRETLVEVAGIEAIDRDAFAEHVASFLAPTLGVHCVEARARFDWIADFDRPPALVLPVPSARIAFAAMVTADAIVEKLRTEAERAA